MAYASIEYASVSGTTFALTNSDGNNIPYIKESDITVKVNGVVIPHGSGAGKFVFNGAGTSIILGTSVTNAKVEISRTTGITDPTVTYTPGSTLVASDLNNADNQIRYGLQEFSDDYAALLGAGNLTTLGSFLGSADTWVSNDAKAATTGAIDARVDAKTTAKVKDDIIATAPVSIADDSPSAGKITVSVDAKLTELATMDQNTANSLADLTSAEVQILDGATLTTTELNYVDGVTSAVQTQIDGKQAADAQLTELATMGATTAEALADLTQSEVQILDGATVSTTELNVLDGVTSTTTELNILDGVTATATELNVLDGVTATTAEINYVDGVTSNVQTQIDAKQPLDADLTTLAGMQAGTASVLAGGTALTSTLTELNQLDGKTLGETSLTTNSNTAIPTSKAVADHVASSVTAVGGLVAIAGPTNFPATQPAQGVVVSIGDVGSGFTTSSNEITITNGAGTNNNVRITGFPTSLAATTLQDDTGIQVTSDKNNSTSGSPNVHRYVYHKWLAKEDDIKQLSDDINEFNERYRTDATGNNPSSNNHAGDLFYNQGSDKMYVRNGANNAWEEVTSSGDFKFLFLCPKNGGSGAPTFNGSEKEFDLRETSNSGTGASVTSAAQLMISVNGVIQKPNAGTNESGLDGFVLADSNTIKFCQAPVSGDEVFIIQSGSAVTLNAPANNTVATDTLQNLAVTTGKIADLAVTTGKIADQAVDLTKLPHGSASSNGKFLRSNNGADPTWETVTVPKLDAPVITGGTEIAPSGTLNQTISNYSDDCSYTITPTNCNAGSVNASGVFVITHTSGTPSYTIKATTDSLGLDDSIVVTKNLSLKLATPGLSSPADAAPNTNVAYTVTSNDANDNKLVVDFGSSNFTIQSVSVGSSAKVGNTAELTGFTTNNPVLTVQFTAAGTYNVTATAKDTTGTHPDSVPSAADSILIASPYNVDYLVIAGGGGGGDGNSGGGAGGGAGGYRNSYNNEPSGGGASSETALSVTPGTVYTITVGNYGEGRNGNNDGASGSNSSIVGSDITDVIATGGGGGGGHAGSTKNGSNGGSGGGGGRDVNTPCVAGTAGAGTSGQGYAGSAGSCSTWGAGSAGGGGGAGEAGGTDGAGYGGDGLSSSITGSAVERAGGGGGSSDPATTQSGGAGGGGNGSNGTGSQGTPNTGSGGGGGGNGGGNGGTGIVILRMATSDYSGTQSGGTVTTSGSDTIISYTTVSSSHTYTA